MVFIYYWPNRMTPTARVVSRPRSTVELEQASAQYPSETAAANAARSLHNAAISAVVREIFLRVPPPTYNDFLKHDRRSMSVNDVEAARRGRTPPPPSQPSRVRAALHLETPATSASTRRHSEAAHRTLSILEPSALDLENRPPAYARRSERARALQISLQPRAACRASLVTVDSTHLSPNTRETRLPSYEEATGDCSICVEPPAADVAEA